ncbi:mucin-5AC-like [Papaver somniferum]|uniref:mucin-5AC-like n=1 Tax=Papaver somniferum TaxID=3469 RepID=UPI000E703FAB|nr:mucin-5AC-like [Papaver somniferum]
MRLPKKLTRKGPRTSSSTDPPSRMDHPDATPSTPPEDADMPVGTEVALTPEDAADPEVEEIVVEDLPPPPPHYELHRLQLCDKDSFVMSAKYSPTSAATTVCHPCAAVAAVASAPTAPASSAGTGPGYTGNFVATRTRKRKASVDAATPTPTESSKRKGKLKGVIDLEALDEDPKAVEEVLEDESMEDIKDTGLNPRLDDIEEDFSKDILSPVRAGSVEGKNLLAGSGAQLINPVSVQAPVPTSSLKIPSFSAPTRALHVVSATAEAVVVSSKSLPSSPATSLQSSSSFAKFVTPVMRVSISGSQPKKKVVISLGSFSFNVTPTSFGSAQSVSTAPVSKVVGPPPSSPDWTRLGNLLSAGDMDLGGAQVFPSVPSSSTMPCLRRGEGSTVVSLVHSQAVEGVVAEPRQGKLSENLSLGSSDDVILEAILRDSKGPFSVGVDHHRLSSSFEVASQLDVLSAQYRATKKLFFYPDCLRSSQSFGEIRRGSIQ